MIDLLQTGNFILASALIIISFALLIYLFPQNWRNPVQRGFSALLLWVGIAFVPAAYLHFSDAVLRSTFDYSPLRRAATGVAYLIGTIFLWLVLTTDLVVTNVYNYPAATQFGPGPLFALFAIYFFATTA